MGRFHCAKRAGASGGVSLLCLLMAVGCACPMGQEGTGDSEESTIETQSQRSSAPRVVEFQPGIHIDFRAPQVEIDGEVILREGELELFAYSKAPTPKEHETILLLRSRPLYIHQALGLIGLTPGRPVAYDPATQQVTPPLGDAVEVVVRYELDGKDVERSACDWMFDMDQKRPMRATHWLFAGSGWREDGRFLADVDGVIVPVVNFASAVLSLAESHSESNDALWLSARTEAIPPIGTPVTLILRPARAE